MAREAIHRFEHAGRRFAIDPESCFCFECDGISWDVLEYYPAEPVNRIYRLLEDRYDRTELAEVVGELEWLRSSKSVLAIKKREELLKSYEVDRGAKRLTVVLSREEAEVSVAKRGWFGRGATVLSNTGREGARALARDAVALLLGRSGTQKTLELEFAEQGHVHDPELLAELSAHALRVAKSAGKNLSVSVLITDLAMTKLPKELEGHAVGVRLSFTEVKGLSGLLHPFAEGENHTLARLAKTAQPDEEGVSGYIIVRPGHASFGDVVRVLDEAGFGMMVLDYDGAYAADPSLDPSAMIASLEQNAVYYAEQLLRHKYFRADPIASLFWRIYSGTPTRRIDPAGTNELCVLQDGGVFPNLPLANVGACRLGAIGEGLDEPAVSKFEDVGAVTTQSCMLCWARGLCGGGSVAVHHALTGSYRQPADSWCEAQRAWTASAVAAFHKLSSAGVHFDRVYKSLGRRGKPSIFTMARAALTMTVGLRPTEEADAAMLTKWESWNEAAYFLCNETGILLPTRYDREMESLHPTGLEQEFVLLRKTGQAFGLFKMRPDLASPGTARAWLYFRKEEDYRSDSVRKGFRALIKEAGSQQALQRLTVPVSHQEFALADFLEAVGFHKDGVLREALYLHGAYHDVAMYSVAMDRL